MNKTAQIIIESIFLAIGAKLIEFGNIYWGIVMLGIFFQSLNNGD